MFAQAFETVSSSLASPWIQSTLKVLRLWEGAVSRVGKLVAEIRGADLSDVRL